MFDPTKIAALKVLGFGDADITALQSQAEATEKAADAEQVAYKADEPAYPDIVVNGVTYKAALPALEGSPEEEAAESPEEAAAEGDEPMDDGAAGGLTLSPEDLSAIGEAIGTALQGVTSQIMGALDLEKKVGGHVQAMLAPFQAQKDATDAERAEQIAHLQTTLKAAADQQTALKAQLDELLGLQPAVSPRATEAPQTILNPFNPADNALLQAVKDRVSPDQLQQHTNGFEDLAKKLLGV